MKKYFNELMGITKKPEISIQEDKKITVNLILYFTNILGVFALLFGIIEYTVQGVPYAGLIFIVFFFPLFIAFFFSKKLSYNVKSLLIVFSGYLISTYVLYNEAFYGASLIIYLTLVIIGTSMLGIKAGMIILGISMLTITAGAYTYTKGIIIISDMVLTNHKTWIPWLSILTTFLLVSIIISLSVHRLYAKLYQSFEFAKKKSDEVTQANAELSEIKQNLEKLVQDRTAEIEEKNEKLIASNNELKKLNEELERFNTLFVGREFRIKELKDKVKELEKELGKNK